MLFWLTNQTFAQNTNNNLDQAIDKAREQQLWSKREWHVLLHYSPSLIGNNLVSLVDDKAFFLADNGKVSPQDELESTLTQLFHEPEETDKAIACRFPARMAWLVKSLNIDSTTLPQTNCKLLNNWLNNLQADGLSLIFPVSVLNSPASIFGHTFLRFDRKTKKQPDLLAWTVSYAAHAESERGISFAFKGLFGGYPGKFSLSPYYVHVKEYSDMESRDIWEYQLNFRPEEIRRLLLHLWEILPTYFDYYFIDENCAYQLLTLLEAARPELKLSQQFYWDAIPSDTIKAITHVPGLLKKTKYRPSNRQIIQARSKTLDHEKRQLAKGVGLGQIETSDSRFTELNIDMQAQVLELAYDYAAYLLAVEKKKGLDLGTVNPPDQKGLDHQSLLHHLLIKRNRLSIRSQRPRIVDPKYRPDQSHNGHRIALRYGYEDPRQFLQFDFRWVYHDLYDPASGFIEGAQLEFFKPAFRYYPRQHRFNLESLNLVNIISAPLWDSMIQPFSWELSAAIKRRRFKTFYRPIMAEFKSGMGLSYQLSSISRFSIFANALINIGGDFSQYFATAFGSRAQLINDITDNWQFNLYGEVMHYFYGIDQTSYLYGGKQRLSLGQNQAVIFKLERIKEFGSAYVAANLSWQYYF